MFPKGGLCIGVCHALSKSANPGSPLASLLIRVPLKKETLIPKEA